MSSNRDAPVRISAASWRLARALAAAALLMPLATAAAAVRGGAAPGGEPPPVAAAASPAAANGRLQPFKADFVLEWKGLNAASASLELTRQAGNHYSYVSRNNARGVFRTLFPAELVQTSLMLVEGGQVRPLSYRGDDGSADTRRDISLDFDWERRRVTGVAEDEPVDLALQTGIQDIMSVQIALIVDLLDGRKPAMYTLVDKNRIKEYLYSDEGGARVDTPAGTLDTVIWSSRRPGSDRVTRVWYAPPLGYSPVKAERRRGNRVEWSMRLVSLQR